MIAADRHIDAPQAALARGELPRSKVLCVKSVPLWTSAGNLRSDLEYILQTVLNRQDWVPCTLEISTTHPHACMTLFSLKAQVPVQVHYGQRPLSTVGPVFPVRRTKLLEGGVIGRVAELLARE